jgi:glycosyltransferase involved in cell wall biosynthesis
MKIVYIIDALAIIGGLERILIDKMNYLANEYNYEIYLITTIQGEHPFIFPLSSKIKHIDLNTAEHKQYNYKYPKRLFIKWKFEHSIRISLQKHINEIEPDIIIGTTKYKADIICKLKSKAKRIIESHLAKSFTGDNEGIKRSPIIQLFFNLNLSRYNHIIKKYSDAIVTLTKGDAIEWGEPHKTYVIPNVITQIATTLSSCENKKVIAVGRLTHQKGFDTLIKVWKIVNFNHPNWELNIYGTGELKNELTKQIHKEGLHNNITIHPPTPNIYQEMKNSSIFAFPSRYEGFGLILIEAMTNGIPCVSFDCPYGPSDIITNGEDGFLITNGDIQVMADKICYLIENEDFRKQMGQKAHQSAMRYAPENIMPMWEKLLNEIINV